MFIGEMVFLPLWRGQGEEAVAGFYILAYHFPHGNKFQTQ